MSDYIVGIDLGTTNSEISVVIDGEIKVLTIEGDPIVPSCVALDAENKLLFGQVAKNQMVANPEATVLSIKRKMGQNIKVTLRDRQFSPEEISSLILQHLKNQAEQCLGSPIKKAVITVPAYFNDHQRNATKNAGELAGLEVVRIINEPTAAALAYDVGHAGNQHILVYDLGGGTFDVSLVIVESGVVEVKASHGDTMLGGDDFDQLLIDYVTMVLKNEHNVTIEPETSAGRRLLRAVEKAKRELSDAPFARIREEYLVGDIHADIEIGRSEYEAMIKPLLQKTLNNIHLCLKDAAILPGAIDRIVLVGGSTRTPLVQRMLEDEIGIEPHHEINPDTIVSMGAALQAASIAGAETKSILVDVTPYSFGIQAINMYQGMMNPNMFSPVINRNTPLPAKKTEAYSTMMDFQEKVEISVYQGEAQFVTDNIFIGKFFIEGLSKVPAGNVILANLELDLNGILKVTAIEKSTGLSKTVVMDIKNVNSRFDLEEARQNLSKLVEFEDVGELAESANDKNEIVSRGKELRKRAEALLPSLSEEDAGEIRELLDESLQAIQQQDWPALNEHNDSLSDMIFYLED